MGVYNSGMFKMYLQLMPYIIRHSTSSYTVKIRTQGHQLNPLTCRNKRRELTNWWKLGYASTTFSVISELYQVSDLFLHYVTVTVIIRLLHFSSVSHNWKLNLCCRNDISFLPFLYISKPKTLEFIPWILVFLSGIQGPFTNVQIF